MIKGSTHTSAAAILYTSATTTYQTIEVDGLMLFYKEAGLKDAPTIVLLHGYPSSSRMWDSLIPLLAGHYHIIAPDYPGFGLSDSPTPSIYIYTFENIANTINQFLIKLGLESYVLFMQDYGGPVGFRLANLSPEKIKAIIVQNANAYEEGLGEKWANLALYWKDPASHPEQLEAFMSFEGARQRHLGNTPNPERYNPETWQDEYIMLTRPGSKAIQASLFYDYQNNIKSYPKWQAWMRQHQPPALILWGKYDPSFIVPGAQSYKRDLPLAELHLLNAGHFALDEANEEVAKLTLDFVNRMYHV